LCAPASAFGQVESGLAAAKHQAEASGTLYLLSMGVLRKTERVQMRLDGVDSSYQNVDGVRIMSFLPLNPVVSHIFRYTVAVKGEHTFRLAGFTQPQVYELASAVGPIKSADGQRDFVQLVTNGTAKFPGITIRLIRGGLAGSDWLPTSCKDVGAQGEGDAQDNGIPGLWSVIRCERVPGGREAISRLDFCFDPDGKLVAWEMNEVDTTS
jgi:hypothetical protein